MMIRRTTIKGLFYFTPLLPSMFNLLCLPSLCFFVILFHFCCSYQLVFGTTLVHEVRIPIAIQNVTYFLVKRDGPC